MSDYTQKVLWGEGMLLAPHHLQQSDRYLEDLLARRARALNALDWGLLHLRVDTEALAGGELNLLEGAAVFQDGVLVSFPNVDQAPAPRKIEAAYPAGAPSLGVYLATPRNQHGELQCRTDASSEALTPYDQAVARIRDDLDASQEREINVARKRLRVLFTSEPREAFSCLPIAVIRRTASGGFELEEQFIPSCQYASASKRLMALVRRVLEIMVKKGEELSKQRRHRGDGSLDPNATEQAGFLFLHTMNQFIPRVRTLFQHPRQHPLVVYQELAGLLGTLSTFSTDLGPGDVPPFNPEDLSGTFLPMEAMLLKLLGTTLSSRCVPIPLRLTREMVHSAQINDERLLNSATWYLGVLSDVPPEKIVAELPIKGKLSSGDQVDALIVRALPGMQLIHMDSPPGEVPAKSGRVYFQLGQEGPHWEAVKTSGNLAIYVPSEFTNLKLELMAVKD